MSRRALSISSVIVFSAVFSSASLADDSRCRFATFGDLMAWGERNGWVNVDWTDQCNACGLSDLSADLEMAFGNEWINGNKTHPVYRMKTNSAPKLTDNQRNAKQCAQSKGQIAEFERMIADLDMSDPTSRELASQARDAIRQNREWIAENCGG